MTEDVHVPLGAYVLGGLTEVERRAFEDHLDGCSRCRDELAELAPVAALLGRVAAVPASLDPAPEPALQTLLSTVRAKRRRTRINRWVATAAAVCLVAAAVGVALNHQRTPSVTPAGPALAMTAGPGLATAAQISITHKAWGTAITLHADDLPTTGTFTLQAIADDGRVEPAATWGATTTGRANVDGATSIQAGDLGRIRILGPDHDVIADLEL